MRAGPLLYSLSIITEQTFANVSPASAARIETVFISKRPPVKRVASFNEQRDPQAKPAVLQYTGKTAVNNKN